ncbi:M23 family metallopeptidase [Aliiglaciecola sp. LCG003]|uniref:M23 family metallopeptidase n=1 Tax=Aliiglaciecola sp. LCG003 TaxID=3053655 RepID=UPI002572E257|nr:M23 family metallopeptidase [Aliiglaciecola sp. LCG003]WJG09898.1 M23 family metallopeptidase [Aliiglaciecola sp. LCG003]
MFKYLLNLTVKIKSAIIFVLLWMLNGSAYGYCIQQWACFSVEENGQHVEVFLENKQPFVITSTLSLATSNLRSATAQQNAYQLTRVLQGFEKQQILWLYPQDVTKAFSYRDLEFNWTPGNMYAKHDDQQLYLQPFAAHSNYPVIQGYSGSWSHFGPSKYALDFDMPVGTPVHAARGGLVIDLTEHHSKGGPERRFSRFANFVTLLHSDETTGEYYHLRQNGVVVKVGDKVIAGQLIGYSGNSGFSSMPHLHFAVYIAKRNGNYQSVPVKFTKPLPLNH